MLAIPTQYALKALLILREGNPLTFVQVRTLAIEANVPGPYLSKIMKTLVSKGIVESRKGPLGGVRLAREPKVVSFYDVCLAMEDPLAMQRCFMSKMPCNALHLCTMHVSWKALQETLFKALKKARIK